MKILIVEDEQHLADGLRFNLESDGYETEIAGDGESALERLNSESFDAVVLDVMLPGISGFGVAGQMRERGDYTPVLMLTALSRPEEVLEGFEAGADDYLAKPFELKVFLARLNGLLRRRQWLMSEKPDRPEVLKYEINGRIIDLEDLELVNGEERTRLTLMEANLLRYLIENEGRAVSRKTILEDVWQLNEDTDTRAIDNFIVRLRRQLEDKPSDPQILQTVRGVGYRLVKPENRSE